MATVIDSLLIELGLDTSKFNSAQQKSVESLRKFDEQAQKTAKTTNKGAKDMGDGFTAMKDALVAFGTVFVGLSGFKNFISETTKANVELGRSAHILNMSSIDLKSWGQLAEMTGGNVESMTATIKGLQQALVGLKYGDTAMVNAATQLGAWKAFDINKMSVDLFKLSDAIVEYRKTHTEAELVNFTSALGIDQGSMLLLEKGSAYLHQHKEEFDQLNDAMNKNADTADKLNTKWVMFKATIGSIGQKFFSFIAPALLYKWGDQWAPEDLKNQPVSSSSNAPRNIRNNNPGNLKFNNYTQGLGATGADSGGFAIFPSMEAGKAAQESLLKSKYQSGLDTLHKLYYGSGSTKGWLGSGADLKDAQSAIANTMRMTGLGENQRITPDQLSMVRQAMQNNEGMIGSKMNTPTGSNKSVTSSVNIQNQTINTQATDAHGIAKDMHSALAQNTLINAGIVGVD